MGLAVGGMSPLGKKRQQQRPTPSSSFISHHHRTSHHVTSHIPKQTQLFFGLSAAELSKYDDVAKADLLKVRWILWHTHIYYVYI